MGYAWSDDTVDLLGLLPFSNGYFCRRSQDFLK